MTWESARTQNLIYDSGTSTTNYNAIPVKVVISVSSSDSSKSVIRLQSTVRSIPETVIPLDTVIGASFVHPDIDEILHRKAKIPILDDCLGGSAPKLTLESLSQNVSGKPFKSWCIFAVEIDKTKEGDIKTPPKIRCIQFQLESDKVSTDSAQECITEIRSILGYDALAKSGTRFLLILNPFGGTGSAMKVYNTIVRPMFRLAGIEEYYELKKTERKEHAIEIGNKLDVSKYKAVVTISGDGVFHELLTGLASRKDHAKALNLPIGSIPAGSGNGMTKNLDTRNPILATLSILKGQTRKADIFSCIQGNKIYYSHLAVFWSLIADIDIESEQFRSLGELRFTIAAVTRLLRFRNYRGRLFLLPPQDALKHVISSESCSSNNDGLPCKYTAPQSKSYASWPVQIDSNFQYFAATNMSWVSSDFCVDPYAKIDSGTLSVQWSEKLDRGKALGIVLDSASATHLTHDHVKAKHVVAFVLEPEGYTYGSGSQPPRLGASSSDVDLVAAEVIESGKSLKRGILDVSGEEVAYEPIQVEIHPRAMTLILPPWMNENRWIVSFEHKYGQDTLRRMTS